MLTIIERLISLWNLLLSLDKYRLLYWNIHTWLIDHLLELRHLLLGKQILRQGYCQSVIRIHLENISIGNQIIERLADIRVNAWLDETMVHHHVPRVWLDLLDLLMLDWLSVELLHLRRVLIWFEIILIEGIYGLLVLIVRLVLGTHLGLILIIGAGFLRRIYVSILFLV